MEALEKSCRNTTPLGFIDGYLNLGRLRPLARIEDREFDEARIRVLLTAAMGGDRGRRALPYL